MPAHATANKVIASAKRLIDVRHSCRSSSRIAEINGLTHSAELSQVPLLPEELAAQKALFPEGRLDQDLQQVDLRDRNSWRLTMAEVPLM